MKHFINLKDIPAKDLRKIIIDAKKRKNLRKNLGSLEVDKGSPLKGKMLVQMFEKASLLFQTFGQASVSYTHLTLPTILRV